MKHYPILAWPGGKRRLAKVLLPMIQSRPHTCYVEEFAGGGSMFFLRQPAEVEVLNDVNVELMNLYRVVKNHLEEFIRQFKFALASRQLFEWHKGTPPEVLTDIQRAARFLYIQKLAFGSKVSSQTFGISPSSPPRFNILRLEEDLSQAHLRLARVWVEKPPTMSAEIFQKPSVRNSETICRVTLICITDGVGISPSLISPTITAIPGWRTTCSCRR